MMAHYVCQCGKVYATSEGRIVCGVEDRASAEGKPLPWQRERDEDRERNEEYERREEERIGLLTTLGGGR